jgi:integrase
LARRETGVGKQSVKKTKRTAWRHPWYRVSRDAWYVNSGGKKVRLTDRDGRPIRGKNNKQAATDAWHEMVALGGASRLGDDNPVRNVLDLFLQYREPHVTYKTLQTYQGFFKSFCDYMPGLLCRDLTAGDIERWWYLAPRNEWASSTRSLCGSAFKAAFKWATGLGRLLKDNPLKDWKLPPMRARSHGVRVSEAEFNRLLGMVKSEPVRDILTVLWWTGTRPVNLARATQKNVVQGGNALQFDDTNAAPGSPPHKTFNRTGRPLIVPLPDAAKEVVLKLVARRPHGPLFLSPGLGQPWTAVRLANLVMHYSRRAGLKGRFMAYACRHSKATNMLEAGRTHAEVADFLGNTPAVIRRNYDHVRANVDRVRALGEAPTQGTSA